MGPPSLLEQLLLGAMALLVVFWFWPGVKQAVEQSKRAKDPDWMGALIPLAIVILFVILLLMLAR